MGLMYDLGQTSRDKCCGPCETSVGDKKVYYPSLYLDSKQFPPIKGLSVGDEVKMTATGKITRLSLEDSGEGKIYSGTIELHEAAAGKDTSDDIQKAIDILRKK